jgi:hypothetical protein
MAGRMDGRRIPVVSTMLSKRSNAPKRILMESLNTLNMPTGEHSRRSKPREKEFRKRERKRNI